jgi:hypothetical protein
MSFKLNNPPYEDNKVKVYKVPMEEGVLGKANNMASSNEGFSIHINQKVNSTPKHNEVVNHENGHIDQMNRGDLAYDDDKVVWKGKEHSRENMPEGDHDLEWEKEIYDEQQNQSPMAFKLREGKGNNAPFNNLSGRELIKPAPTNQLVDYNHDGNKKNDGDPPVKPSEIPYEGSKKADQQKSDLAKIGTENQVELRSDELGGFGSGEDMGVKKYTSFYKAPNEELRQKGNEYWASLSEPEKQAIRDKKSRYTVKPIKMDPRGPQPIETTITPRKIKLIPPDPIDTPEPGDRNRVKTKREIKREALSQYGGTYRDRYGLGKNRVGNRNYSKALTGVFGQKSIMSKSAQDHYDEQLAKRKELKRGNKNVTWLNRDERMADQNTNLHSNQNVTRTETKYDQDGNVID